MFSYIVVAWNTHSAAERSTAASIREKLVAHGSSWIAAVDLPGFLVVCGATVGSDVVTPLSNGCGAVLGTLFEKTISTPVSQPIVDRKITLPSTQDLLGTQGKCIQEKYWGSYVLAFHDPRTSEATVFRGPMAQLPCFHCDHRGVRIFFSVIEDVRRLGMTSFSINWDNIRAQATQGDYMGHETGLREVFTLESGEYAHLSAGHWNTGVHWDPRQIAGRNELKSFEEAASEFHNAVQSSVTAWSSHHASVVQLLSGGLDSSIVLSCLARAPHRPQICSLNYYSRGVGEERRYARGMAKLTNTDLIEHERRKDIDLRIFLTCARTVSPVLNASAAFGDHATAELARQRGATAIFDGELGDNVFGGSLDLSVVCDSARRYGLRRQFFTTALNYSILGKKSLWRSIRRGLKEGLLQSPATTWSARSEMARVHKGSLETRLATIEAFSAADEYAPTALHPWMRDTKHVPIGKKTLLFGMMIVTSTAYHPPFAPPDAPPIIRPLASELVVDVALRTPTHYHIAGAQDRAVARHAFAAGLTDEVINRGTGKGGPDLWAADVIQANLPFLREMLLGGILVKERILDPCKVERVLSGDATKVTAYMAEVIIQLYIEAWLRRWAEVVSYAAVA